MPLILTDPITEPQERLGFTVDDVRRMLKAGILDDDARYELIEGEIVPVQAHNPPHMRVKRWLTRTITLALGERYWVDSEPSLYLDAKRTYTLPDIVVYPNALAPEAVRGPDVVWLIEVADATLAKDRGRKAKLYARHGVREYWVVNAQTLTAWVHLEPAAGAYAKVSEHPAGAAIAPQAFADLAIDLREAL